MHEVWYLWNSLRFWVVRIKEVEIRLWSVSISRGHNPYAINHMEGWGLEDVKKFQGTWTIYKETLCTLHGLPQSWAFKSAVCRRGVGACSTSNHVSRATWMWARRPITPVSIISVNCWIMKRIANSLQNTLEKLVWLNYKGAGFIWEAVLLLFLGKLDPSFVTMARLNRLLYTEPTICVLID